MDGGAAEPELFSVEAARREGVDGWVRNMADGSVEVVIEGDIESVDRVEAAVRRGPSSARVERFDVEDRAPTGRATGFSIR